MLKQLNIDNLILIEAQSISFMNSLNVITGETGSGKTALLEGLRLISGVRADTSVIRKGSDKAYVEALFDIDQLKHICDLLTDSGIDHQSGDELIIKREISSNGKSRAFINNQSVQLTLLKKITTFLFDLTGQHASQKLISLEYHRHIVDTFGNLLDDVNKFKLSLQEELALKKELDSLIQGEAQRLRELETCQREYEEITEAQIKDGEEEELFAEYTRLTHAAERREKLEQLAKAFNGENGILTILHHQQQTVEELVRIDDHLTAIQKDYKNILIELQELSYTIQNAYGNVENNPYREETVNERLSIIHRIKRKYGPEVSDVNIYLTELEKKLDQLKNTDEKIEKLEQELKKITIRNNALAAELSKNRKAIAKKMQKALTKHIQKLNMPKAEVIIEMSDQPRTPYGDDQVEFFLIPNVGEKKVALKECASGGEMSRVLLAIQVLLSGKEQIPIIIFDEIDANIGGKTATIVGQKIKEISKKHQVICITHFHQVARQADYHIQISKEEKQGRTFTRIDLLHEKAKAIELERMLGG